MENLLNFAKEGFIPGPKEDKETFMRRVHFLKKKRGDTELEWLSDEDLEMSFKEIEAKLGCIPKWIKPFYSNKKLLFWQGALSWICTAKEGIIFPMIQLNKGFKKGRYLGYQRQEVLSHEIVHALRSAFDENRYEELFAYFFSKSKFRAFLGPLFRKPSEVIILMITLIIALAGQVGAFFFPFLSFSFLIPICYFGKLLSSLIYDQSIFRRALKKLNEMISNKSIHPLALAARLTDQEIKLFCSQSTTSLFAYIQEKKKTSLRMQQLDLILNMELLE